MEKLHGSLHGLIVRTCCAGKANRGVETVDINFVVLFEYFIHSFTTIFVTPWISAVKVTTCFDYFMSFIRYHSMAPSIINQAHPVLSIRCFWVTQLQKSFNK
ncbi:hypothetical protein V8G54_004421 [Vigna mungo]|uniref:Uncharacterized protein n=1 Tax=Vigna mungo TaxID=3915 RepID=A0AAQ3SCV5_VIGMU